MLGTAMIEILVILLLRPPRLLLGLVSKRAAARLQRIEDWLLHQGHAMGVEARTRYEVEKGAEAKALLAGGTWDQSNADIPGLSGDHTERARRISGADQALPSAKDGADIQVGRGPRQVEAREGQSRSEEMQEALLQAQREERARQERERRRRM